MHKHCKGCRHHHVAGHPKTSPLAPVYNDWCCNFSGGWAKKLIGHCKLHNGKTEKSQP